MANLQKIKTLAVAAGIGMESLASQLGITPQALSKLIRNNSTKIETLEAIARILNVPVTVFFDDASSSVNVVSGSGINVDAGSGNRWSQVSVGGETARFLSLLEEKDRQMNRLISIIENLNK